MMILLYLVVIVFGLIRLFREKKPKNFPPGPKGYPLVGHLPLLGQSPHKTLLKWKSVYGPIIGVWFGSYRTVVISDVKLIKEALNLNAFAGRPNFKPVTVRSGGVAKGILFTEGHHWLEQRRFAMRNLRDFGFGSNSMESKIQDEIIELMEGLKGAGGSPVQMRSIFNAAVLNALWSIMLGERIKQDDEELKDAVHRLTSSMDENNTLASIAIFMPWLANIAPKLSGFESLTKEIKPVLGFLQKQIDIHGKTYRDSHPRDFIDVYMDEVNKTQDLDSSFHESHQTLLYTLTDLFLAGAETTSTTLNWMCAYLVTHPQVQSKLMAEIDVKVGKERFPCLSDRNSMPYTEAVLNEVMRFSSLVPFSVFHSATEDVSFHGYDIPKGTMIIPNLYSVHFDEQTWGDPNNFRPERFLDEHGNFVKNENVMAFSAGKRVCLGERLARDELFLFTAHLFQKFQALPTSELPSFEPRVGIVMIPQPYEIMWKER